MMTIYEIFPPIKQHPIFVGANEELVNRHLNDSSLVVRSFSAGKIAYSSESDRICIGILLCGMAQAHTGSSREAALLRTMGTGEAFGIANLYAEEEPFPSRILCMEECKILFIDGKAFKALVEEDRTVMRNYLSTQSRKIVYLNRKITTLTAGSAEKKLAVYLLDHEIQSVFTPPCSMSRLSELLGMGRASLYRAFDSLVEYGFIEKQDKIWILRDLDALMWFI